MKTIEQLVDDAYNKLFDAICKLDDDMYELKVEYKSTSSGKTITRSWRDREERLQVEVLE